MNKLKQNQKGFTLIELLVVIAIIGLLASVVLLSLSSARSKGRDAKRVSEVRSLGSALELYADGNGGTYPAALSSLATTFIASVPQDPDPGCGLATYTYGVGGTPSGTTYSLTFCLENGTGSYGAGTHTLSQGGLN